MRGISGPSLFLTYYYHHIDDRVAFKQVYTALTNLGAKFAGTVAFRKGTGVETAEVSVSELHRLLNDSQSGVIALNITDAVGLTTHEEPEILKYIPIARDALFEDHRPITTLATAPKTGPLVRRPINDSSSSYTQQILPMARSQVWIG